MAGGSGSKTADRLVGGRLPASGGRHLDCPNVGSESRQTYAEAQLHGFSATDYQNQRRGMETGNGGLLATMPAGAPSSFIDLLQQLGFRPKGLIAPTLVQLMPPDDHKAHQGPGRDMLPIGRGLRRFGRAIPINSFAVPGHDSLLVYRDATPT